MEPNVDTNCPVPPQQEADQQENEERALSVFASERNEDLTALGDLRGPALHQMAGLMRPAQDLS
jgi:hypothetical protein